MSRSVKFALRTVAVLVLVVLVALVWNRDRVIRLYHVTTLFDAGTIVHNFSHMDDIFLSTPVKGAGSAAPWPVALQPLPQAYVWQGEQKPLAEALAKASTTSLLVVHDGNIVAEDYFLGTGPDDRRISWSMAKSVLSALFGIAIGEGAISSLDANVADYVPALKGGAYDGVSIRNVLNMASGVAFNEDYLDFNSDINRMGRVLALGKSMDAFAAELKARERPAGLARQYVSIDTHILGMVLRAATGKRVPDYLSEKLWTKLGAGPGTYYLTDGYGVAFVLGGLAMTTRDYARVGQLFLDGGRWQGEELVPAGWVRDSTTPNAPPTVNQNDVFGYGYQWWVPTEPDGEFYAVGIYGQYIYINPKARIVVVKTAADRNFRADGHDGHVIKQENIAMFRAIAEHYSDWRHPGAAR
ncbi:MAG: serine hydrolase [Hyphomicrobiales bacterium]